MIALNLKGDISQILQDLRRSKLRAAHPVNYFPGFWGKNVKNCQPSKLFLFTPCCGHEELSIQNNIKLMSEVSMVSAPVQWSHKCDTLNDNDMHFMMCFLTNEWYGFSA